MNRKLQRLGEAKLADGAHTVAIDQTTHQTYFPLENVNGKPTLRIYAPNSKRVQHQATEGTSGLLAAAVVGVVVRILTIVGSAVILRDRVGERPVGVTGAVF